MLLTAAESVALAGARRQTALKAFCTWQSANASLAASSAPSDAAPLPAPARVASKPSAEFGPARQRFVHVSSGVTKPNLLLVELMKYFAFTVPAVYSVVLVVVLKL